jgi:cytochrome c oxidase subunit I
MRVPLLFSLAVIALFGSGGFGGLFLGNATADMQLHDTYFVVGHFHMMIGGVTMMATFAALYYWFPKMFGRAMNETLGKAHFWLTFALFFIIFFMQHFIGLEGAPRRYYSFTSYDYLRETRGQNLVVSIMAMVLIAGQFLFLVNFVWSVFRGRRAMANHWGATTLEWTTPSPPPHGNFGPAVPVVHRWAYEYGVENGGTDFATQNVSSKNVPVTA